MNQVGRIDPSVHGKKNKGKKTEKCRENSSHRWLSPPMVADEQATKTKKSRERVRLKLADKD